MTGILINSKVCRGCGTCVFVCPALVLELEKGKAIVVNPDACLGVRAKQVCTKCIETEDVCIGCVACVRNCPTAAIEILRVYPSSITS